MEGSGKDVGGEDRRGYPRSVRGLGVVKVHALQNASQSLCSMERLGRNRKAQKQSRDRTSLKSQENEFLYPAVQLAS